MSSMPATYLISFTKGFRIGYHKPELSPPAMTLLRAMASVASMIGDTPLLDSILNGYVATSAMLPLTRVGDQFKPLVPLDLSITKHLSKCVAKKSGVSLPRKVKPYITLAATIALVRSFDASARERGRPSIEDVAERLVGVVEVKRAEDEKVVICEKEEAARLAGSVEIEVPKSASEHRNTIDRLTGAARPFVVTYASVKNMSLLIDAPAQLDDQLSKVLRLLGEVGVGGLRSRGLGRFAIERAKLSPDDERALERVVPFNMARRGRYLLALGELPLSSDALDWRSSFFEAHIISGYMGPPYAQALYGPLVVTRPGALIKVKEDVEGPLVRPVELKTGVLPSTFIFNPLVIVGE